MKIKMLKTTMGNVARRYGQEYEVSEGEGNDLIRAGHAVKVQVRETTSSPQAANRETASKPFTTKKQ